LDVCTVDIGGVDYLQEKEYDGWSKYNWDTGAGVTAFVKGKGATKAVNSTYRTASGQMIDDFGPEVHRGTDEKEVHRVLRGRATEVHKNLVSAAASCKYNDAYVWHGGGVLVPRDSPFAQAMRKRFDELCEQYGMDNHLVLYEEKGVYNFYLKEVRRSVAAVALADLEDVPVAGNPLSGGPRQGKCP